MISTLVVICAGLAVLVIGLVIGNSRRSSRLRRMATARLDEDEKLAERITADAKGKASSSYWSCKSTTAGRSLIMSLAARARMLCGEARRVCEFDPEEAMELERQSRAALFAAETLLHYADTEVVPLIGRMRDAVEMTHCRAAELRRLLAGLLTPIRQDPAVEETAERIDRLHNALEAYRPTIAGAPVTALKTLNKQLRVMNEALAVIHSPVGIGILADDD